MKILRVSKKNTLAKLEEVLDIMEEVCEELKKEDIHTDSFSVRLDIMEIVNSIKESSDS